VYGGDLAIEAKPDLGWLMKRIKDTYNCQLLAIQSYGTPDDHCEYCFM
jgi:hypothetical protein